MIEQATCRNCGMTLKGKNYCLGGSAHHPETGERCKVNHYGGYVCSERCDRAASQALENSMPGAGCGALSSYAQRSLEDNWKDR